MSNHPINRSKQQRHIKFSVIHSHVASSLDDQITILILKQQYMITIMLVVSNIIYWITYSRLHILMAYRLLLT